MTTEEIVDSKAFDRYECRACGYVYEPAKGDSLHDIPPGTAFEDLPSLWRCPVCSAKKPMFSNLGMAEGVSGFKENLKYGLGVNSMTSGQKSLLIFGALALFVVLLLSLYTLQ